MKSLQQELDEMIGGKPMRDGLSSLLPHTTSLKALVCPEMPQWLRLQQEVQALADSPFARAMREQDEALRRMTQDLVGPASSLADWLRQFETGALVGEIARMHEKCQLVLPAMSDALVSFSSQLAPWLEQQRRLTETLEASGLLGLESTLIKIDGLAMATTAQLGLLDGRVLGDKIPGLKPAAVERPFRRLTKSYDRLVSSVRDEPVPASTVPLLVELPTRSVYAHTLVVGAFTRHAEEDATSSLWIETGNQAIAVIEDLLPRVKPGLLVSWRGVRVAIRRRQPDWLRQASASLRYLLIDVLDRLAPKSDVLKAGVDRALLMEDGSPSRRAQVRWLCRGIKNTAYSNMVSADLESALTIITTVNQAVHEDGCEELEQAFERVTIRADIALQHLLEISSRRQ